MPYFNYNGKNVFYKETGIGPPVLFLHGNTASSKLFEMLLPLYHHFKTIVIDFLGHGQSDRIEEFPIELWFDEAMQTIALIEHLNFGKVNLVGTSGGAWVAVNVALERPDLVNKIVADSFDGRTLHKTFVEDLIKERAKAKNDIQAKQFMEWCHGSDWEDIVNSDTKALLQCARDNIPLFRKELSTLQAPTLFMGSLEDSMVRENLLEEYNHMASIVENATIHMFETGEHPAIASNAEQAAKVIGSYFD